MRRNKKGFTVVELSIVIVVIAILAAILIPTMISLVNKANVANDTALVRNLNTALALDGGEKHETMQDALDAAKDAGYDVAKINAKATDNEILWDSANDVFCYMKNEDGKQTITYVPETTLSVKDVKNYQYWVVASAPSSTYSTYLYNYTGNGTENITTGIDVGSESVSTINYTNTGDAQNTAIRTNGGKLTINGSKDTIKHYGTSAEIEIVSVSSNSFYEFGDTKLISIANGRLVLTDAETANVEAIYLTATEQNYNNITLATMSNATLPEAIKRDAVDETKEKVVCQIQTNVDSNGKNAEKTETIVIKAAQTVQEQTSKYTGVSELGQKVLEAPTGSTEENATQFVGNKVAVSSEAKESTKTGYILFSGGAGTEVDPYLIADAEQFKNIKSVATGGYSFKLIDNISLSFTGIFIDTFTGTIDGDGNTLTLTSTIDGKIATLFSYGDNATFKNMKVSVSTARLVRLGKNNLTFNNVDISGSYSTTGSSNESAYVSHFMGGKKLSFVDCDASYDLVGDSYQSIFLGGYCLYSVEEVEFKNLTYSGVARSAQMALLIGNGNTTFSKKEKGVWLKTGDLWGTVDGENYYIGESYWKNVKKLTIENCVNNGTLVSTKSDSSANLMLANISIANFKSKTSITINEEALKSQLKTSEKGVFTICPELTNADVTYNSGTHTISLAGVTNESVKKIKVQAVTHVECYENNKHWGNRNYIVYTKEYTSWSDVQISAKYASTVSNENAYQINTAELNKLNDGGLFPVDKFSYDFGGATSASVTYYFYMYDENDQVIGLKTVVVKPY